jgi:hypothetical protein
MGLIYSDIPELEGSNTEIALANLSELELSLESLTEERLAHLMELSDAIIADGGDVDIVKSIILSIKSNGKADFGSIISENRHVADEIFSRQSTIERLTVFKEVFGKLSDENPELPTWLWQDEEISVDVNAYEKVAYLKNSYNDSAFMQFSSLLDSPRAAYFNSVSDVCESVYSGDSEYCILPVETSEDGKLLSFYELIFKYRFKIVLVYDLQGEAGYTRYALLSKSFVSDSAPLRLKTRNKYFEFFILSNDNKVLEEILCAADFCSLRLRRIDTLNIQKDKNDNETYICPVFRADGADMTTFLTYLAVDFPDFIPIGLYTQI